MDGSKGEAIIVNKADDIAYLLESLNNITFSKGKPSIGYMGYTYSVSFLKANDKVHTKLIINSTDTIRYNGFFYTDETNSIPYDFITALFENY